MSDENWYPEECPITGRKLFMVIGDENGNMVPTYGGPFDSYTLAERDESESSKKETRFICKRYDHDLGGWLSDEIYSLDVVLIEEEYFDELKDCTELKKVIEENARLKALNERIMNALTPSAETKATYIGEFHFFIDSVDEDGVEISQRVDVPWTTIKEIMATIRSRSLTRVEDKHDTF